MTVLLKNGFLSNGKNIHDIGTFWNSFGAQGGLLIAGYSFLCHEFLNYSFKIMIVLVC